MAVIIGSGISASQMSLKSLLNLCVLKGVDRQGLVMAIAKESNALGAVSILESRVPPHRILEDRKIQGLFLFEDDPFHYMSPDTVAASLKEKEFVLAADVLPTHVMDLADLVVPTGLFIEKEGTFFAGDGFLRKLAKMTPGPAWQGFRFLQELLGRLGGARYIGPGQVTDRLRQTGIITGGSGATTGGVASSRAPPRAALPPPRAALPPPRAAMASSRAPPRAALPRGDACNGHRGAQVRRRAGPRKARVANGITSSY